MQKHFILILFSLSILVFSFAQGPYAPAIGQIGTTGIYKDSTIFQAWATHCELQRGWQNILDTTLGFASVGDTSSATDKAGVNGLVSLGDGGIATLSFNGFIYDDVGADFAVFENSFDGLFLELAFVEVSSDGVNFFRFNAVSLTPTTTQVGTFSLLDATNLNNLAGKYKANYGTPFDLSELAGIPGLDISKITHVRIVDVVGSINPLFGSYDSQSNAINDPFPTPFPSGGFDLDAVGVIHYQTTSIKDFFENQFNIYPNPFKDVIQIENKSNAEISYQLTDIYGKILISETTHLSSLITLNPNLSSGIYFISISQGKNHFTKKLIKSNQ